MKDDPFSGVQPADMARLEAVQQDLQRQQAINGPLLRAPGSDTFQNLASNQNLLGAGAIGKLATKPFGWLYQKVGVDKGVNDQLMDAALESKGSRLAHAKRADAAIELYLGSGALRRWDILRAPWGPLVQMTMAPKPSQMSNTHAAKLSRLMNTEALYP